MALLLRRLHCGTVRAGTRACRARPAPAPPAQGPCSAPPRPPCEPCESPPAPPCRGKPRGTRTAVRIVCCPPPAGCRPPCEMPPPACTRTCENRLPKKSDNNDCMGPVKVTAGDRCGLETSIVTARLDAAAAMRRESYLREIQSTPASPCAAARDSPSYKLSGEDRDICLATDGHDYTMPCAPGPPPPCGPCRERPPVELLEVPDPSPCQARRGVDPCSHRPRVLVSIDRSTDPKRIAEVKEGQQLKPCPSNLCGNKGPLPSSPAPSTAAAAATAPGLTARIMKSLSLGRSGSDGEQKSSGASCSRPACPPAPGCRQDPNRARPMDESWCKNKPAPHPPPPSCREPTFAERMRWRPAASRCERGPCKPCGRGPGQRQLHTSAATWKAATTKPAVATPESVKQDNDKLQAVLKEYFAMKGAARGRELPCEKPPPPPPPPPPKPARKFRGVMQLELEVNEVDAKKSVGHTDGKRKIPKCPPPAGKPSISSQVKSTANGSKVEASKRDSSWSIKSLKKFCTHKNVKSSSSTPTVAAAKDPTRPPCKTKSTPDCPPQPCPPYRPYGAPNPDPCAPKIDKKPSASSPKSTTKYGKIESDGKEPLLLITM